jgi:hypothetical protein
MTSPGPFADSVYAQPRLTHLVRQYGNPALGESLLSSLAGPSAAAVSAQAASLAKVRLDAVSFRNAQGTIVGTLTPLTTRRTPQLLRLHVDQAQLHGLSQVVAAPRCRATTPGRSRRLTAGR